MTSITIPGVLIAVSRDVAEAIEHGEGLRACGARLAGVCRLLDAIGWTEQEPTSGVDVDLGVNAATLRRAVEITLPLLRANEHEHELYEALREFASAQLPAMPRVLEIPADVIVLLRSALRVEVARTSEDLAHECSLQAPAELAGMLARFDVLRAALDAIGWGNREHQRPVEIEFALHGQTIVGVLEAELVFWRSFAEAEDVAEREDATNTAALIERFLAKLAETPR